MEGYLAKYATKLFVQMTQAGPEYPIEFIDPIATAMKLVVLAYKDNGTKMSIKSNKITIQESWMLQGFQRWINEDQREQLYQLKLPLFYFRGIVLGHIHFNHLAITQEVLDLINTMAIKGLKKMKSTYNYKNGSLVDNCIDQYLMILSTTYAFDEYSQDMEKLNKPTLFAVY